MLRPYLLILMYTYNTGYECFFFAEFGEVYQGLLCSELIIKQVTSCFHVVFGVW